MTGPQAIADTAKADFVEWEIPLEKIHPDPVQPRIHPDAELAASIKSQGILQAISLEKLEGSNVPEIECPDCGVLYAELAAEGGHYMIVDGERRYRGSIAAGKKTVLAKIVPPATEGKRLLRQVTSNTGKPLTPIEEAMAYKRIMEVEGWGQAELARQLGKPRSVVGDRIRLIELDPVWLEAISAGKLQVSHAPILSTWSVVPSKWQQKAAATLFDDYRFKRYADGDGTLPIDELPRLLEVAFRPYICPMDRCKGYRGPTVKVKHQYGGAVTYAADIKLWRPFNKKYESAHRKALQRNAGSSSYRRQIDKTVDNAEKDIPAKRKTGEFHVKANRGEVVVYETDRGWQLDGIAETFLRTVDPAKLTRVYGSYGSGIVTSDMTAVAAAKEELDRLLKARLESKLAEIRGVLRSAKVENECLVTGPGARTLINTLEKWRNPIPIIALAMGMPDPGIDTEDDDVGDALAKVKPVEQLTDEQAATLATGYIAVRSGILKVPDIAEEKRAILDKHKSSFKLPPRAADGQPAESKKALKRKLRAAGKQVGDPSRAPKKEQREEVLAGV